MTPFMIDSMAHRNSNAENVCKFAGRMAPAVVDRYGCPAEAAVRLANSVIAKFGIAAPGLLATLERDFHRFLYRQLRRLLLPVTAVFWSPKSEKLAGPEAQRQLDTLHLGQDDAFRGRLNSLLFVLNRHYHSGSFLHQLDTRTTVGRSRCHRIALDHDGIRFSTVPLDTLDCDSPHPAMGLDVACRPDGVLLPQEFLPTFQDKWSHILDDDHIAEAAMEIRRYVDSWSCIDPDMEAILRDHWQPTSSSDDRKDTVAESARAFQHFALMSLFLANNDSTSAHYFLSPNIQGQYDSSMVVCWHSDDGIPRPFIYLLSMLLGLNASPILHAEASRTQAERLAEARKVALSHFGHTLKHRLDVLSAFLDANAPGAVRLRADMLKDLTLILQLNSVDDRQELCEKLPERKRKRFMDIEGVQDVPAELNLLARIREWAQVLTREDDVTIMNADGHAETEIVCPVALNLFSRVSSAKVGWQMTSRGERARLNEAVFRELLFELLNNAWKYGDRGHQTGRDGSLSVQVDVILDATTITHGSETIPLLVLTNAVHPKKVEECPLVANTWKRWPDEGDVRFNGPGMALDLLRRLRLGDMYHCTFMHEGELYVRVGVSFVGLTVNAGDAKEQIND